MLSFLFVSFVSVFGADMDINATFQDGFILLF